MTQPLALLDASALAAWIFGEPGADAIDALLPHAAMTSVNFAETVRLALRMGYLRPPRDLRDDITGLGLTLITDLTSDDALRAAELIHLSYQEKAQHNGFTLALGDAVCLAVSERLNIPAVTGDRVWFELGHLLKTQPRSFR